MFFINGAMSSSVKIAHCAMSFVALSHCCESVKVSTQTLLLIGGLHECNIERRRF